MDQLLGIESLAVQQVKEMAEVFTGFETRNKYRVMSTTGSELYLVEEEAGFFLTRWFLKAARPFTMTLKNAGGQTAVTLKRPFRWYFYELSVYGIARDLLGTIKRKFSVFRKIYMVTDADGRELFRLDGPFFHPWTFHIVKDGERCGKITKKWSGLLKESFTDADNFGVIFPTGSDAKQRALLVGAVFLIDFAHFENM